MVSLGSLDYLYLFNGKTEINIDKNTLYTSSKNSKSTEFRNLLF